MVAIILVVLLCGGGALVGVGGVLVALLLPAVGAARNAAQEVQHSNDLKQLALAYIMYLEENENTPPQSWDDLDSLLDPLVRGELESRDILVNWGVTYGTGPSSEVLIACPRNPLNSDRPMVKVVMMDGSVRDVAPSTVEQWVGELQGESGVDLEAMPAPSE